MSEQPLDSHDKVSKITGAKFLAESLKAQGISHVFFMDAIARLSLVEMEQLGIKRILGHSEKGVAYMADGFARASGRPAVCMAQSVGAANLAAGLQESWFALSPVIALTGRHKATAQYRNAYQELEHEPFFSQVTKFSGRVDEPEQMPHLLRQAFREVTTGTVRPVHLDVLGHTASLYDAATIEAEILGLDEFSAVPAYRIHPDPAQAARAAIAFARSRRPLIVAGMGVVRSGAEQELVSFAERHSVPIATSLDAKHVLIDYHPLNAGIVGNYSRSCANQALAAADLVIFVGSDTGDMTTANWTMPSRNTQVIQIDIDPAELGRNFPRTIGIHADPKAALMVLADICKTTANAAEWVEQVQALVSAWRKETEYLRNSEAIPMRPERLCKEIGDWLPSDAYLVADTGYSSQWTGTTLYLSDPRQRYLKAAGSLGWAFPAAIGVKCAMPDRPVVCFTGDGGLMYHLLELETARRHGLNTVTVVNNNSRLNQGRRALDAAYEGRKGNKDEIYAYRETNFATIAKDMDCFGIRISDPADVKEALDEAVASGLPAIVDVVSDPDAKAPLAWVG
jgi:acetolactate synthase-1/2/3 large subunit